MRTAFTTNDYVQSLPECERFAPNSDEPSARPMDTIVRADRQGPSAEGPRPMCSASDIKAGMNFAGGRALPSPEVEQRSNCDVRLQFDARQIAARQSWRQTSNVQFRHRHARLHGAG